MHLPIINYERLLKKDSGEVHKLLDASQDTGMFYLDLRGSKTSLLFEGVPALLNAGHKFFKLPLESEEKTQSFCKGMERGYHTGDGFQYYEIPRDDFQSGEWALPSSLESEQERITRVIKILNDAARTILTELSAALQIDCSELSLESSSNDTALKLMYKAPVHVPGTVIHPAHTDSGLVTLLWYDEMTTQLPVDDGNGSHSGVWKSVRVMEGPLLVNIADELARLSAGRLKSPVHRVVAPPGEKKARNGLIYLLRACRY